jgi:23S rRNA (guanosine2251-2'-O)-methyltransferase
MQDDRQLGFRDKRPEALEKYLEEIQSNRHPLSLLAAGVDDVRNIGALFRLADAARLEKLYFLDWPEHLNEKKLKRVSRSTVRYVPYEQLDLKGVKQLATECSLIGLEITDQSIPYTAFAPENDMVLVVGHEAHGIPPQVLSLCTACIHLPMYGVNTSMNVAMAAGIAVYGALDRM